MTYYLGQFVPDLFVAIDVRRDYLRRPLECSYCGQATAVWTGAQLYCTAGLELSRKKFHVCDPCKAWVGCHKDSARLLPLGTVANLELRKLRSRVHALLDPLWQRGAMGRKEAYAWLAGRMGITAELAHVALFREPQCMAAILILSCKDRDGLKRHPNPGGST